MLLHTEEVTGSIPVSPTSKRPGQNLARGSLTRPFRMTAAESRDSEASLGTVLVVECRRIRSHHPRRLQVMEVVDQQTTTGDHRPRIARRHRRLRPANDHFRLLFTELIIGAARATGT